MVDTGIHKTAGTLVWDSLEKLLQINMCLGKAP
jgi:hypothetical protein